MNKNLKIVFFGTPRFSVKILESLDEAGLTPSLVITAPDKPKGRKMVLTPPPVKLWAQKYKIKILQPKDKEELRIMNNELRNYDLFIVASYGKILPKSILEIPKHGTINVHPSLLPKYRGASPIQSVILNGEKETGTTIMLMNEKMDEGDILTQEKLSKNISNLYFKELEERLADLSGKLLVETIPKWISGEIEPTPQDHSKATYTKMISKKNGEIDWSEPDEKIYNKIRAFTPWPSAYTFFNNKRIIITKASLNKSGRLEIEKVKPEGKNEIAFEEFLKNNPNFSSLLENR